MIFIKYTKLADNFHLKILFFLKEMNKIFIKFKERKGLTIRTSFKVIFNKIALI